MVPFAGKHVVNGEKRYVYAPFALFFASWDKNQRLAPIAVQVLREPDALVWTSQDTPSDWVAAKFYVSNADFAVHQFRAHALWCHLAQEPILISVSRVLSECHPVWKLLRPHFHGLLNINDSARGTLVNVPSEEESMTDKIPGLKALAKLPTLFGNVLSMGAHGNAKLTIDIYKTYDLKAQWFKNDLEARGLLDPQACEALGPYPYRDDGLLLFDSIEKYVTAILRTYYKTDADITDDAELQEWAADASSAEAGAIKGFPTSFDNIDSLVEMCTNLIFTASAYHAAVNYSQVDYATSILNIPGSLYQPVPTERGKVDKAFLISMMPSKFRSLVQLTLVSFLSQPSDDKLGTVYDQFFVDAEALQHQKAWQEDLKEVEAVIAERNSNKERRPLPYPYMLPSQIPNSTSI